MTKLILVLSMMMMAAACAPRGEMLTVEDLQAEEENQTSELPVPESQEMELDYEDMAPETEVEAEVPSVGSDIKELPIADLPSVTAATPNFYLASGRITLAHGPAQFWEGCQPGQYIQGGYESDTKCSKALFHPRFGSHMNQHFFRCAKTAAQRAGLREPARIFIRHIGSYNDRAARGSTRLSMHAYARALDLVNINLYDSRGALSRISTHVRDYKGSTAVFYDEFRACWKSTMPSGCRSGDTESSGSIGFPGSKAGGNTLHNDHLHLSLPLCAG